MNERWRFYRPECRAVVVMFLLVYQCNVGLSFGWSLNDQGLALLKLGDRVVRDAVGETPSCSWLGFGLCDSKDVSLDNSDPGDSFAYRRLLQGGSPGSSSRTQSSSSQFNRVSSTSASIPPSESPLSPSLSPNSPLPLNRPVIVVYPTSQGSNSSLAPSQALTQSGNERTQHLGSVLAGTLGGAFVLLIIAIGVVYLQSSKVVTVKPWATGLSGQLQKAFVTGVPKLNRSEIVVACEDFSNIIGFFSDGTVYKGTLSSGVEIAVTLNAVKSRPEWSKNSEEQFRKKIEKLSKVNHKNFVNLIGFCEDEEQQFTRVMVYEYAPNGTLFEHLHTKEAEHLDWGMRLRIAMGMAYCLDHMHQLTPPIAHRDLHSSSVYLTEDYAAKISDLRFWNEMTSEMQSAAERLRETPPADHPESNVYNFGVILFEMITGRIPYLVDDCLLTDWANEYLRSEHSLTEMVDPTLKSFDEEQLEALFQVIKDCVKPDPKERPRMAEIAVRLREITNVGPDGAIPKLSPLWWAELEIISS